MPVRGACDRPAALELAAGGLPDDGALGVRGGVSSPAAEPVVQGGVGRGRTTRPPTGGTTPAPSLVSIFGVPPGMRP